ncbi:MAG: hypothetical protein ACKV2Q_24805 [Planctomycetaceae bacterium]
MTTSHRIWLTLALLVIVLVGCAERQPADLEQDAERNFRRLKPLAREAAKIEKLIVSEAAASAAKSAMNLQAIRALRIKLSLLEDPAPNPTPPPAPAPAPGPPAPVPEPKPVPPLPTEPEDGRFALAKEVYRATRKVTSPDRATEAAALAKVFRETAAEIKAGKVKGGVVTPQHTVISELLKTRINPVIAPHLAAWDATSKEFAAGIVARATADYWSLDDQWWSDLFEEIARGLEAAAKT